MSLSQTTHGELLTIRGLTQLTAMHRCTFFKPTLTGLYVISGYEVSVIREEIYCPLCAQTISSMKRSEQVQLRTYQSPGQFRESFSDPGRFSA